VNATTIALLAFAVIFGISLLGMRVHSKLSDLHLTPDTKETVRLGMGLIATMTALLLGLLIATAKGSYDTQRSEVIQIASRVAFLDRALAVYGPESGEARERLRDAVQKTLTRMWPDQNTGTREINSSTGEARALYESIQNLAPKNEMQQSLKARALETSVELSKTLWHLSAQAEPSIVTPLLIAVITWLAIIFLSFGLFAPANKIVVATLLIVAISVSSALFLILELDRPFDGAISISSAPMQNVLTQIGK
jgi:hypothetical protein